MLSNPSTAGADFLAGLNFPQPLRDALARRAPPKGPVIKICGLSSADTLAHALDAGADMVGLVFFPKSPRHVELEAAARLAALAGDRAIKVALTVDAADDLLKSIVAAAKPDMLQLHGKESPARAMEIRSLFGLPVMKAIGISGRGDLATASLYHGAADRILFDAKPPAGADLPGGNGLVFDWDLLKNIDLPTPFMLSGGLDPENVAQALRRTGCGGVDVSSGVESAPGQKDPARMSAFIQSVRSATSDIETLGSEGVTG